MIDLFREISQTLSKNKLRTMLTGLSVSWGIFILIVLLGAGNGLKNGVESNFSERATNSITLWSGRTSKPFKGLKSERKIEFTENEIGAIKNEIKESDIITPRIERSKNISYKKEYGSYRIMGVLPGYTHIEKLKISDGRFLNDLDIKERNKVIVIDKKIATLLFKEKSPLGEYVSVEDLMFKVIGVNDKPAQWGSPIGYIPFSTAQTIYNPSKKVNPIIFTVNGLETKEENEKLNEEIRILMGRQLHFDPSDKNALWISNNQQNYIETQKIFGAITTFVFVIGILTLIAGIVGVSNIMLVSIKERTREFGIRKAIGAKPFNILNTIVLESLLITSIFGYVGVLMGVGLTELVNYFMEKSAQGSEASMTVFLNPTVNLKYVFIATIIIIIAGVISGYLPARKAVKIKPIEAMRQEV